MMLHSARRDRSFGAGSSSFLVRLSRVSGSEDGTVRVYLRNLQTGEELYLGDPERVGEVLAKEIEAKQRESEEDAASEAEVG